MSYNISKTTILPVVINGVKTSTPSNQPRTLLLPKVFKVKISGVPDCYGGVDGTYTFVYSPDSGTWIPHSVFFPNTLAGPTTSSVSLFLCDTSIPQTTLDPNSFHFISRVQAGTCLTSYGLACSLYLLLRLKRITLECEFNAPVKLISPQNAWMFSGSATVKNKWSWLPDDPLFPTYGRNVIALGYAPQSISDSQLAPCQPVNYSLPYPCSATMGGNNCLVGDCPETSYKEALNLVREENGTLVTIPITFTISGSSTQPPIPRAPLNTISPLSNTEGSLDDNSISVLAGGTLGSGRPIKPITLGNNAGDAANKVLEKFFEDHTLRKNMNQGLEKKLTPGLLQKILEMFKASGFGTIMIMPIIPKIPVLGGGETASTGIISVIAFAEDNTTYEIFDLEIPWDSPEIG